MKHWPTWWRTSFLLNKLKKERWNQGNDVIKQIRTQSEKLLTFMRIYNEWKEWRQARFFFFCFFFLEEEEKKKLVIYKEIKVYLAERDQGKLDCRAPAAMESSCVSISRRYRPDMVSSSTKRTPLTLREPATIAICMHIMNHTYHTYIRIRVCLHHSSMLRTLEVCMVNTILLYSLFIVR